MFSASNKQSKLRRTCRSTLHDMLLDTQDRTAFRLQWLTFPDLFSKLNLSPTLEYLKGSPTCSRDRGTVLCETCIVGQRNLDVYVGLVFFLF